ncbi:DUF2318 domain-containing protein [Undibacterium sp. TS12]|uniref:DUF2318 domain-containing protein n=1 Tax=Undibacterium sp. TS12 TaxID=2908202 RepID=UPI001F4C63E0|nr:DUF2318 domain-containing protein [Undibacterium sp. TS12]MCH8620257.1 DUF2318 domain-containing protein [Undibacterium sp. TS12]
MKTICDICGKYSEGDKTCSNCGAKIFTDEEINALPTHDNWGWAIFSLEAVNANLRAEAINFMREQWITLEKLTILNLVNSQLSKFRGNVSKIKVIIREDFFLTFWQELSNKFNGLSVEFKPEFLFETADEVNQLLREEQDT